MSGPNADELVPLSAQLLAYYREMARTHSDNPATDACAVCHVHRCEDWRYARERLLCAGESPVPGQDVAIPADSTSDSTR